MRNLRNWLKLLIDKLHESLNLPLRFYLFPYKKSIHSTGMVFWNQNWVKSINIRKKRHGAGGGKLKFPGTVRA